MKMNSFCKNFTPVRYFDRKIFNVTLLLAAVLVLSGCKPTEPVEAIEPFQSTDVTGANFAKDFQLLDHLGHKRTLADFKGKVVAIFFGYIHCPDICPTTLTELASVMDSLGQDANKVQVLFVTLDPVRDTQEVLAKFVPSFNPTFIGLHGTPEEIADSTAALDVAGSISASVIPTLSLNDAANFFHSAGSPP